ncbi:hypothetical protein [Acinetobacter higginsii]|uniref:hypothetical protein n=1 Tax=Acinetobacter higginsii TaxID=70347 RepID=UPI001F4B156E|nr:hypothetical protein [Acinetobacter higginsii]MCH7381385.1 hypothetical protein [Acinetobacter higginsii]
MEPLTVLLWLLCAFLIAVFFGVVGLFVYMVKQRKQALEEFNANRIAMGLKPHNMRLGDNTMTMIASERTRKAFSKAFTKGPS